MKKTKILLIFTGGTIVQVYDKKLGALRPAKNPRDILQIAPELQDLFTIDYKFIANLDSSNIQPHHWTTIAEAVYKNYQQYDGFVITHGTDRKSTRLNSSHQIISYAVFCLKKKNKSR